MVSELLKRMYDVYQEDLNTSKVQLEKLNGTILENDKFIELLESEQQKVFSDFSPREIDTKNNKKIQEVKVSQDKLKDTKLSLIDHIESVEKTRSEIKQAMDEVEELQMTARDSEWFEKNVYNAGDKTEDPVVGTSKNVDQELASKIENIISYILVDPMRAKIELQKLI